MKKWGALVILAAAQFVMVLDQAVMNVSISQLVADFDTTVTAIQGVITLYSLMMAMLMLTGGKVGDIIGRRRAFAIGLVIYGCGSALTAASQSVPMLALGWSVLEGVGAALVLPALAALIAGNYVDGDRRVAYAVIGGVAGAGIAVGPILGGWATTELSWRVVFVGEVVLVLAILAGLKLLTDAPGPSTKPKLDWLGAVLSASGLGIMVFGVLNASVWGWLQPKDAPFTVFGFAPTAFVVGAGGFILYLFVKWQGYRETKGTDPLVHLALFKVTPLRAGLQAMLSQNLILMGVFFTIPLYLQLVLGFDALDTGIKMLPVSIAMFLASVVGSRLALRFPIRSIVRAGLVIILGSVIVLLWTIQPSLKGVGFALAMAMLGLGMGFIASQVGNVVQSSVDASGRSEAGGLQYTSQQLGSAVGVALIGAIVLSGLTATFVDKIQSDPRIDAQVQQEATTAVQGGVSFVSADTVEQVGLDAGLPPDQAAYISENYADAQLVALKVGLLASAFIAVGALMVTRGLPSEKPDGSGTSSGGPDGDGSGDDLPADAAGAVN